MLSLHSRSALLSGAVLLGALSPLIATAESGTKTGTAQKAVLAKMAPPVGHWVAKGNANNRMSVSLNAGLVRISGGESFDGGGDAFRYSAACALEMDQKQTFNCVGWGGKLNGEDFIYSSRLKQNGVNGLLEEWFAENGDRVSGKTHWMRAK